MLKKDFYQKIGILLSVLVLLFIIAEIVLRHNSRSNFFTSIIKQEVVFYEPFTLNTNNVFSHSSYLIDTLKKTQIQPERSLNILYKSIHQSNVDLTEKFTRIGFLAQLDDITIDNSKVEESPYKFLFDGIKSDIHNQGFKSFKIDLIKEFSRSEESDLNQAVQQYLREAINKDGFRSIEMKPFATQRKKILLLGDSYAYGYTAVPFYHSFSDQLLEQGYVVYNAGIPGTNSLNYLFNARFYIEELQPDYVFTFLYLENDIMNIDLSKEDGFIPYHASNTGWHSSIIGKDYYPNKQEWLNQLKKLNYVPETNQMFKKSATWIWAKYKFMTLIQNVKSLKQKNQNPQQLTNAYLREIEDISKNFNAKSTIVLIPECEQKAESILKEKYDELFEGLNMHFCNNFTASDFRCNGGDQHFNNSGHQKMMHHLIQLMEDDATKITKQ